MFAKHPVISRHRLPRPYRQCLTIFWAIPALLLFVSALLSSGFSTVIIDPRLLLPLLLMLLPAWYCWREGLDVLPSGIVRRVHLPRFFDFSELDTWYYDKRPDKRLLTVWDRDNRRVIECRVGHLTDLPLLLSTLKVRVRSRNWPN